MPTNPVSNAPPEALTGSEPQHPIDESAAVRTAECESNPGSSESQPEVRTTILVVDDRLPDREYLVTLLEHAGYRVLEAADGVDALAKAREEQPDLVITDVLMQGMDGFELVRQIREHGETRDIPVILFTAAYDEEAARDLVALCPGTVILVKPTESQRVLRTIAQLLRGSESAARQMPEDFQRRHLSLLANKLYDSLETRGPVRTELRTTGERLASVAEAVPALMFFVDAKQRCQFVNETCRDWLGMHLEEVYGKTLAEVLGEKAYERVRPNVIRALSGQRVVFEMLQTYRDISRYIRATYVPDCEPAGEVRGFLSLEEDLTDHAVRNTARVEPATALTPSL